MTGLPETWQKTSLGRVVEYGKTSKAEPTEIEEDAWVLELEDVEKDTSRVLARFTFKERQSKSTKNRFEAGDVLYGKLRPYLNKVVIADRSGYCTTEIIPLKAGNSLDNRYLFYWLKHPSFLGYVESESHGLSMPRLGTETGRAAPFVLAPLSEQKRIADKLDAVLSKVDACRDRLDRIPGILKRFRQSVLAAATSGKLTEDWRSNDDRVTVDLLTDGSFPGLSLELPSSWEIKQSDEVCSSVRDGTHDTPTYVTDGISLITSKNIRPTGIDFESAQKISEADHFEISKRSLVERGDVLFSMIGSVGHVCIVDTDRVFSIKNVGLFKKNPSIIEPYYLFLWLQSPIYISWLNPNLRGGNQKFASLGLLRFSPVVLPPLEEQAEIIRRVVSLFDYADRLEAHYTAARAQVDKLTPALLTKAFRGELVLQDPNDEPASLLLERINTMSLGKTKQIKTLRKTPMTKHSTESVKAIIQQIPQDRFSFDELRNRITIDYEALKEIVFELLSDSEPLLRQVFDEETESMLFEKI